MRRSVALLLAMAIGVGVVAASVGITALATGRLPGALAAELPIFALQAVMVSIPFVTLALARVASRTPWLVGLVLTIVLWGYFLFDALVLAVPGRGANIGLGLVMLASPVAISLLCVALAFARPRQS